MSVYKKFAKDTGIIGITNIITNLRGLILLPIIAKTLGPSGYGIWAQVMVTLSLLGPVSVLGLDFTLTRFLAAKTDKKQIQEDFFSVFITVLCWSSLIALILFILANPIANTIFSDGNATQIVEITAIIVPAWATNLVFTNFFRAFRQMKTCSLLAIIQNVGETIVIAFLVLLGFGIFCALVSLLAVRIFMDVFMFCMIISHIGVKLPDFSNIKAYLNFGLPLIPSDLSWWIVNSSDRYIIGLFTKTAQVGIYSAAYSISGIILLFVAPLSFVLPPSLSKLYDESKMTEVKTHLAYSLKYFLMLAIPSAFGLSLLAKPILSTLTTSEFISSGSLVIPFVAVSMVLFGVYTVFSQILVLIKKTRIFGILWGSSAIANLILNVIFVPVIGILGAAISTLIAFAVTTAFTVHFSFKYFKFNIDFWFILKSIFASIVMSLVIIKWSPVGISNILIEIGVCAVVYTAVLLLLKGIRKEEIAFFKELFRI